MFVKVHESLVDFKEDSALQTWIYRITINICLDRIKARKAKKRFAQIQSLFGIESSSSLPVEFDHPGVKLEDKESVAAIMSVMNELPENQKTAIILKSIEGLPQKEIASILDIGEKAVESLLIRAKQNIRKKLNQRKG